MTLKLWPTAKERESEIAEGKGSTHIWYTCQPEYSGYMFTLQALARSIDKLCLLSGKERSDFSVLDVGCGRGEFLRVLGSRGFKTVGIDADVRCVTIAQDFHHALVGDVYELDQLFAPATFDVVVCSHVLEHLYDPRRAVFQMVNVTRKWLVFSVPNPTYVYSLLSKLIRRDYSRPSHVYCWDRPHFRFFLEEHCSLYIHDWPADHLEIIPGPRFLRQNLCKIGLLQPFETKLLPSLFPYFSSSLIAVCSTFELPSVERIPK